MLLWIRAQIPLHYPAFNYFGNIAGSETAESHGISAHWLLASKISD